MPLYRAPDCSQLSVAAFSAAPQSSPHSANSDSSTSPYASLSQTLSSSHGPAISELPIYLPPSQSPQSSPPVPHMAADGRYMYPAHYQPEVSPHAYPPTYPAPYDASQFPQNGSRPMRAGAPPSHSHVPPPGAYSAPPPGYPHYGPPAYAVPQSPAVAQWTGEGWQYPPTYPPPDPRPQESQYTSTGRPDAPPNPPGEHRGYPPGGPPNNSRPGERPERDAAAHPQPRKGSVPPTQAALPAIPSGLDFSKIIESYQIIIDTTHAFAHDPAQGRSPASTQGLERMLQAARYGALALDMASKRAPPEAARPPPADRSVESDAAPKSGPPPKKPDQPPPPSNNAADNQTCLGCNATSTPEWRRGPLGPRTLCNACGLVYAKLIKKRTREPGRSRGVSHSKGRHGFGDDAGSSGGSDDDDSYGSQDRRSELGDGGGRD